MRYGVAKQNLRLARERVEQLCLQAFCIGELLHPGFLNELKTAASVFQRAENEAILAAVEAENI